MPTFESSGVRFHYIDEGQGVPFVFQHGLGGDASQTSGTFQPPLPFRLLTLESRGHGESGLGSPDGLSFDQFADDVAGLMAHLRIEKAVLGGISMGAGLALNFALRFPRQVKAMVLVRPAWLDAPLPPNLQVYPRIADLIRQHGPARGRELFVQSEEYQQVLQTNPVAASSLAKQFERPRAAETADILERLPKDAPNRDPREWAQIRVPTLILANDRDPVHPYAYGETLARAIPGATLLRITSKEVDAAQHSRDIQAAVEQFSPAWA